MAPKVGQPLTPAETPELPDASRQSDRQARQPPKNQGGEGKTTGGQGAQSQIAGHQQNQSTQHQQTKEVATEQRGLRGTEFAPQYPQGGYLAQLQQGRESKAEEQH